MRREVLIVGAGPTGLTLALWLIKQDVRVRIVDKNDGPGKLSRAMAVQSRTLELYRQLDIAEKVISEGHINPALNMWVRGERRAHLSLQEVGKSLTPYPYMLIYPQDRHEQLLVNQLADLGITVERNTELVNFVDKGDHIIANLRNTSGMYSEEALFIAGCDGARSVVREQIGSGYPGGTYNKMFYVADVELEGPAANGEIHVAIDAADFVAILAYDDAGKARLIGIVETRSKDEDKNLTFADVSQVAITELKITVKKVNWFSTYHVHHRVTDHYRRGRAFLVGDAAHVHSPVGGQGMNTGIGDAANLAWKLAAVIKGKAPEGLLESYEIERRAFAEKLVKTTDEVFSFVTSDGPLARFVRARVAPLLIPAIYHFHEVREFLFKMVSQTEINYRLCDLNQGHVGQIHGGDRLPWVRSGEGDNYDSLSKICWQVHIYGDVPDYFDSWCREQGIDLHVFAWSPEYEKAGLACGAAYLLRPDTYIGLVVNPASIEVIAKYLSERRIQTI